MSTNSCLNSSSSQFSKFMIDDRIDGTSCTQNLSKFCQNCKLVKDQLDVEIFSLKNKAHQSFMQVIQVQQLHEEQLELIKYQHQEEITVLKEQVARLELYVIKASQELQAMEKNAKHHTFEVEQPSFLIQNIEMIQCNDTDSKENKLDQSSYVQFNEFVDAKSTEQSENFLNPKIEQTVKDQKKNQEAFTKLNNKIFELEAEVQSLWQTNQELKKQCIKQQNNAEAMKKNYDALYRQTKFMSDHIRNLSNDKFKLERKVKELEKQIRSNKGKMELKRSTTWEQASQPQIKINGSGLLGCQQIQNVRNSLENSKIQYDNLDNKTFILKSLNMQDLTKARFRCDVMTKSEVFSSNQDLIIQQETRKTLPSYKRINHIPSFKKVSSDRKVAEVQDQFLKIKQEKSLEGDKSGFMDQIRRQIQLRVNLKKSMGPSQTPKPSLFRQKNKNRS